MADMTTDTSYNYYGNYGSNERIYGSSTGTSITASSNKELDMNDFMSIMCTELSNQSILSGESSSSGSNTDYVSQLAQFTTLKTMKTMTEIIYAQYGASMVGKKVVVANTDSMGNYKQDEGIVDSISLVGGDVTVSVNGVSYPMSAVMEVTGASGSNNGSDKSDTTDEPKTTDEGLG